VARVDGEVLEIMTRLRILVLSLIFLVAGAITFTIQFSNRGEQESSPPVETEADLTLKNIHFVGDKSGLKEWELEAKEARHFRGKGDHARRH
jgi:hypothetical protein